MVHWNILKHMPPLVKETAAYIVILSDAINRVTFPYRKIFLMSTMAKLSCTASTGRSSYVTCPNPQRAPNKHYLPILAYGRRGSPMWLPKYLLPLQTNVFIVPE